MTRPDENQQTVEAALDVLDTVMSGVGDTKVARAALRDLVAQAELGEAALRKIRDDFPDMSLRGRGDFYAENLHRARDVARDTLARLDGAR